MSKFRGEISEKDFHFISKLSTYTLKHTLIRIGLVTVVGVLFLLLATNVTVGLEFNIPFHIYIQVVLTFVLLTETNVLFDNIAERFFPIPDRIKSRIILHFAISLLLGLLSIAYFDSLKIFENILKQQIVWLLIALGLIFTFTLVMFSIGLRITEKWIRSLKEIDRLREAQILSEYNSLQDQLNPHFLFNNLSVLKSLIIYNPEAAVSFTQNFTDVYRYVLQHNKKPSVTLNEELGAIRSYIDLHKERFGEGLIIDFSISDEAGEKELPPLSLQLLIENAIKHNVASKKQPLKIRIHATSQQLTVSNNLNPKESTYSTQKGLSNLAQRIRWLTSKDIEVSTDNNEFKVVVPLI